jgi:hypothetical protein
MTEFCPFLQQFCDISLAFSRMYARIYFCIYMYIGGLLLGAISLPWTFSLIGVNKTISFICRKRAMHRVPDRDYWCLVLFQVQTLIAELNDILASSTVDEEGRWLCKLTEPSRSLFQSLPQSIQNELLLERDPHGNVQVGPDWFLQFHLNLKAPDRMVGTSP